MSKGHICEFWYHYCRYTASYAGRAIFGSGPLERDVEPIQGNSDHCPDDFQVAEQINDCLPLSDHISEQGLEDLRNAFEDPLTTTTSVQIAKNLGASQARELMSTNSQESQHCIRAVYYAAVEILNDLRPVLAEALENGFIE